MKVSVVTPSLNGIAYLAECVESVRLQEGPGLEIEHILVDGGSVDGTPEFGAVHGCRVLTREEYNITYAVNKGIRNAEGTLVCVLGCDDLLLPGAVRAVARAYQELGGRWLVGSCLWIDGSGRRRGVQKPPPAWAHGHLGAALGWSPVAQVSAFLEKEFVEEMGYFDVNFYYAADYEFFLRALATEPFTRVPATVAAHRRHGGNVSRQYTSEHRAELAALVERHAPAAAWRRHTDRYVMKAWMNGVSPAWSMRKRLDSLRRPARQ